MSNGQHIQNPRYQLCQDFEKGKRFIADALQVRAKYVPPQDALDALCIAIRRGTHILFEGERGGGKTAIAEALAEAFGLSVFYMQFMQGLKIEDFLFQWDENAQKLIGEQLFREGKNLAEIQRRQYTREFLLLGEFLAAFDYAAQDGCELPPVIIGDEADKLDFHGQNYLLQILGRGYSNVPRLKPEGTVIGFTKDERKRKQLVFPIVIMTSNGMMDGVSAPLKSRGRFMEILPPSDYERVKILHTQVPTAAPFLLADMSKMIQGIEGKPLKERPALREYIEFLETCVDLGIERITPDVMLADIGCLGKDRKDLKSLRSAVESIYYQYINQIDSKLEGFVKKAMTETANARRNIQSVCQNR